MTLAEEAFKYFHDPSKYGVEARKQQYSDSAFFDVQIILNFRKLLINIIDSLKLTDALKQKEDIKKINNELTKFLVGLTDPQLIRIANNSETHRLVIVIVLLFRSALDLNLNLKFGDTLNSIEVTDSSIKRLTWVIVALTVILALTAIIEFFKSA